MSLPDLGVPEGAETDLNHRPVVQDLGNRIGMADGVLVKVKKTKVEIWSKITRHNAQL